MQWNDQRTSSLSEHQVLQLLSSISNTPLAKKHAFVVLFLRENRILFNPSNSSNFTGGGGSMGTIRTTELSTCGGGRKLFLPTFMMWSTLAYSWTFADNRDHREDPGVATRRRANSRWNMRIATRKRGRCERSLKTRGEDIW